MSVVYQSSFAIEWGNFLVWPGTMNPRCSSAIPTKSVLTISFDRSSLTDHRPCRDRNNSWESGETLQHCCCNNAPQNPDAAASTAKNLPGHQMLQFLLLWVMHTRPFETFWFSSFYRNDRPSFNALFDLVRNKTTRLCAYSQRMSSIAKISLGHFCIDCC